MNLLAIILLSLTLGWDASAEPGVSEYRLYENASGVWMLVSVIPYPTTTHEVTINDDNLHLYGVTAANAAGESGFGNILTVGRVILQSSTNLEVWIDETYAFVAGDPVVFRLKMAGAEVIAGRRKTQ